MGCQGEICGETPIPELAETLKKDARFGLRPWHGEVKCWDSQGRHPVGQAVGLCYGVQGKSLDGRCGLV